MRSIVNSAKALLASIAKGRVPSVENGGKGSTVWSGLADADWVAARQKIDWMSAPYMHEHVQALMGGTHWIEHAREKHLLPLAARLGKSPPNGLNVISIGCGSGWIEKHVLGGKWPIRKLTCVEYDATLLESAKTMLAPFDIEKEFHPFNLNESATADFGVFDVIFFCHSIHHCSDAEGILRFINRTIHRDGLILGCDYFGPARLQVEPEVLELLREIFANLPEALRFNLSKNAVEGEFQPPRISDVADYDPSEAPRSRDIRSLLFSNFPVIETLPMGGTLLRPLITHRAGNFTSAEHLSIIRLLQVFERTLIRNKVLSSDDLFFVLGHSDRF